jgi:hypothetical protein
MCQGTTLVVPEMQQNEVGLLAPAVFCFQLFAIPQRLKPETEIGHLRHD